MMQILRRIVRWIFACDVIDEVALLAKSERSRSYVTEEQQKDTGKTLKSKVI